MRRSGEATDRVTIGKVYRTCAARLCDLRRGPAMWEAGAKRSDVTPFILNYCQASCLFNAMPIHTYTNMFGSEHLTIFVR